MSGNKIIPILDTHKDAFVQGGPVKKVKHADELNMDPATELILCTEVTFKLHQGKAKPAPPPEEGEEPKPAPPPPKPLVVWRKPHCYTLRVVPLAKTPGFDHPFGFAVIFFSFKPEKKNVSPLLEELRKRSSGTALERLTPQIRSREYVCASEYEQDDWVNMSTMVLQNFWHKRLEEFIIPAPEIFQFQMFCCDSNGLAKQVVLSTTRLYVLCRHEDSMFHDDKKAVYKNFTVATLKLCKVERSANRVLAQFTAGGDVSLTFFSPEECSQFVIELHRIFELCLGDALFPHQVVE